jgi:precorrin-3B C17-methyltransferase
MVCSGDAGVYGMAGLIYELAQNVTGVDIEIVPGVTAAQSGAAILGAPLMQDYAVVSLSDLLIPWDTIEKRLRGAASGDFAIVLYNPSSHKRKDHLRRACDILLEYKSGGTACGIVRNIGREGEECAVLTLSELRDTEVDMFTTVFIGSGTTRTIGRKMVTPRGYEGKR